MLKKSNIYLCSFMLLSISACLYVGEDEQKMPPTPIHMHVQAKLPAPALPGMADLGRHVIPEAHSFVVSQGADLKKTFDDVAGLDAVKESLGSIVYYLQNPLDFGRFGAEAPKGVLLYGPPGTGKTAIARALAGEVNRERNVSFIHTVGSVFSQKYVGEGARMVRELFELARQVKPTIIFIDEFEAAVGVRSEENKNAAVVAQFLAEMDGFDEEARKDIFIIAATNVPHQIDEAIIRPGRIDSYIKVGLPDEAARKSLLEFFFAYRLPAITGIDVDELARATRGRSPAYLENLVNQARIRAAQDKDKDKVTNEDFVVP